MPAATQTLRAQTDDRTRDYTDNGKIGATEREEKQVGERSGASDARMSALAASPTHEPLAPSIKNRCDAECVAVDWGGASDRPAGQRPPICPVRGLISRAKPNNATMPNGHAMKNAVSMMRFRKRRNKMFRQFSLIMQIGYWGERQQTIAEGRAMGWRQSAPRASVWPPDGPLRGRAGRRAAGLRYSRIQPLLSGPSRRAALRYAPRRCAVPSCACGSRLVLR